MENFEKQESMKLPKINSRKILFIGWIILTMVLAGVIIYQFGYKALEKNIYQKGIEAGRIEINNLILQNLIQFGKIQINVPDENGKIRQIILAPQIEEIKMPAMTATTTEE